MIFCLINLSLCSNSLKWFVHIWRVENKSLCEELEIARSAASAACMELKEKMGQAVTEVVVLHHTLREVTKELQASLCNQVYQLQADLSFRLFRFSRKMSFL